MLDNQGVTLFEDNREGSLAIISRYAHFQNREVMGAAFDAAQRDPKLRDIDTRSVVDLQFVRELEQSGFLKSLK